MCIIQQIMQDRLKNKYYFKSWQLINCYKINFSAMVGWNEDNGLSPYSQIICEHNVVMLSVCHLMYTWKKIIIDSVKLFSSPDCMQIYKDIVIWWFYLMLILKKRSIEIYWCVHISIVKCWHIIKNHSRSNFFHSPTAGTKDQLI